MNIFCLTFSDVVDTALHEAKHAMQDQSLEGYEEDYDDFFQEMYEDLAYGLLKIDWVTYYPHRATVIMVRLAMT
ncbi:MAG: hypothetical protein IPJ74_26090 [Saprospiraceae bacterium]|nr:hypothetical protein [Saprospiraceae bacterium]